jgi:hypothetical protein
VLSGVVCAGWAVHEIRLARQQAKPTGPEVLEIEAVKSEEDAPDPAAGWSGAR